MLREPKFNKQRLAIIKELNATYCSPTEAVSLVCNANVTTEKIIKVQYSNGHVDRFFKGKKGELKLIPGPEKSISINDKFGE